MTTDSHDLHLYSAEWKSSAQSNTNKKPSFDQAILFISDDLTDDVSRFSIPPHLSACNIRCVSLQDKQLVFPDEKYVEHGQWLLNEMQQHITKPGRTLLQIIMPDASADFLATLYLGLLRTMVNESAITGQVIFIDQSFSQSTMVEACMQQSVAQNDFVIRLGSQHRATYRFEVANVELNESALPQPWQDSGVYLISGGLGGIGRILAADIIRHLESGVVILLGRAPLSQKKQDVKALQAEVEDSQGKVIIHYHAVDINVQSALHACVQDIKGQYGNIQGVIHCAGVTHDGYLINKSPEQIQQVLIPKIQGLHHLHDCTSDQALDFFIGFSSLASVTGNSGQADYALANGYLDCFMQWRNKQVLQHQSRGHSLSINWPLWAQGGMQVTDEAAQRLFIHAGIVAMDNDTALNAFYAAIDGKQHQLAVAYGNRQKLYEHITATTAEFTTFNHNKLSYIKHNNNKLDNKRIPMVSSNDLALSQQLIQALKGLFSDITGIAIGDLDAEERCEMYGIDSIMVARLNDRIANHYDDMPQTIFYQCPTIKVLSEYLLTHHLKSSLKWLGAERNSTIKAITVEKTISTVHQKNTSLHTGGDNDKAIAIIGMSGRFPEADNIEQFWHNLKTGKNCVTEIPADRWSLADFYVDDKEQAQQQGKSYSKWGGFLNGFADFDPLFFNISPKEALDLDPQERLFLENCYVTLERAGVTKSDLQKRYAGEVGVFVGITKTGFERYADDLNRAGSSCKPRTSFSAIANRVSYFFDLNGPSMPVDTMCSSSLTAIHQACESLQKGECQLALAGGVNVYQHPHNYYELCASGMLSDEGLCRSFGEGGSGFVPGEGVASLLLKPLSQAQKDGDPIMAIIRSSAINHGGHAQGFTVPNPQSQGHLLQKVLTKAGLSSEAISYVEAHGTGTQLGDPIEFEGLKQAFQAENSSKASTTCYLGSVKSNIGHLEAAAGITGVIKTVLQMQHKQLVPTLHAQQPNGLIDFNGSPFKLVQDQQEWLSDDQPSALVSSFGAGGANACVLLQAYDQPQTTADTGKHNHQHAMVFSARTESELRTVISDHLDWIKTQSIKKQSIGSEKALEKLLLSIIAQHTDIAIDDLDISMRISEFDFDAFELQNLYAAFNEAFAVDHTQALMQSQTLADWLGVLANHHDSDADVSDGHESIDLKRLAYTLQNGRQAMVCRLALRVTSKKQLVENLRAYLKDKNAAVDGLYAQQIDAKKETIAQLSASQEVHVVVKRWLAMANYSAILPLWVKGLEIDWQLLYTQQQRKDLLLLNVPSYPFSKKRLWPIDALVESKANISVNESGHEEKHNQNSGVQMSVMPAVNVNEVIMDCLSRSLMMDKTEINPNQAFADYGVDSILAVGLTNQLKQQLSIELSTSALFDYPCVKQLAKYIETTFDLKLSKIAHQQNAINDRVSRNTSSQQMTTSPEPSDIAIIGMSGCFPGAENVEQLWQNINKGQHHISQVDRWPLDVPDDACTKGGFLNDIAAFDAMFFNISGVEASHMDPQQRLFLQQVWTTLEDAGYAGNALLGHNCGVYVGCCNGDYQDLFSQEPTSQSLWGNMGSVIPSRIAYLLDLKGPALAIDTSCSSSLVAIHQACQDLRRGDIDEAIAGGVFIQSTSKLYLSANKANMLSSSGNTYSFDARADGFVPGEAAGALMLKRVDDAMADGDHIHAVIKGSGLNNDGATNGITAPSANSQSSLLTDVYDRFDINLADLDYIEAHGTGTQLGDPIEFRALQNAFNKVEGVKQCTLGSIKQNIGHTQFAAGVSGVIKVLLSLKNQRIPPSINFNKANKDVPIDGTRFTINTQGQDWPISKGSVRLAGVSSFGASGTNAHVIIAEAPHKQQSDQVTQGSSVVVISARTQDALKSNVLKLQQWCQHNQQAQTQDVSYTLLVGRGHFEHRMAFVVNDMTDLLAQLNLYLQLGQHPYMACVNSPSNDHDASIKINSVNEHNPHVDEKTLHQLAVSFISGLAIDHAQLFKGQSTKRLSLPTYTFSKDHYWVNQTNHDSTSQPSLEPLFTLSKTDEGFKVAFEKNAYVFEQHQVNGQNTLPGVMVVELLRSAMTTKYPEVKNWSFNNLTWLNPTVQCYTDDLHIKLTASDQPKTCDFVLLTNTTVDVENLILSQGTISPQAQIQPSSIDLDSLTNGEHRSQWSSQHCYGLTKQQGLLHGPLMRALKKVRVHENWAVGEFQSPETGLHNHSIELHPCVLDSVILMSVAFLLDKKIDINAVTSVPFMVEEFHFLADFSTKMWAKMPTPQINAHGIDGPIEADIFDDQGRLCARMRGCFYRPVHANKTDAELFIPSWHNISKQLLPSPTTVANVWLLCFDEQPLNQLLSHQGGHLIIDHQTTKKQLAQRLTKGFVPTQIIIQATCDQPVSINDTLIEQHNDMVLSVLALIKKMVELQLDAQAIQWTLVTQRCHRLLDDQSNNPTAAGLHGLIGSMSKEFTLWSSRLVDLDQCSVTALDDINALPISAQSCSLARRNGAWYQSQLVAYQSDKMATKNHYKKSGNYLVIGGAGGVGRAWSSMIAKSHQAQLIWLGRRGIDDQINAYLDEISAFAPRPIYLQIDATDQQQLLACRQQIEKLGHLNGIVHSAISLNDQSLMKMEAQQFIEASQSKVDISVRLSECFDLKSMDFVLFFSSIQSFAKMPGQSNYAAGCTFEDSFSHYLVSQGVNAKTINWGYWAQIGVVSSEGMRQRMKNLGLLSLRKADLINGLNVLLASDQTQLAMAALAENGTIETQNKDFCYQQLTRNEASIFRAIVSEVPDQQVIVDDISNSVGQQMSAFDTQMAQLLFVQLNKAGVFDDQVITMQSITARIKPMYVPWIEESIRVLLKHGHLQWHDDDNQVLVKSSLIDEIAAWQDWQNHTQAMRNNLDIESHIVLAHTMMSALNDIVIGEKPATDVMFPESSLKLVEGVYRDNKVADYFNQVLCESLVIAIEQQLLINPQKKIRILEVGAGTGGTAKRVFAALKPWQQSIAEYCYTDLSKAFLIHAEKNYRAQAPYLKPRIFNADLPVTEQDIEQASYDIIIATNVIHATGNVRRSLKHIKQALVTNGLFLLNELNDNVLFSHLTFGLLEGWWNYDDPELRIVGSPALSEVSWKQVLAEQGFNNIAFVADRAHHLGQQLIMAQSDGLIKTQSHRQTTVIKPLSVAKMVAQPIKDQVVVHKVKDTNVATEQLNRQDVIVFLRNIVATSIEIPADKIEASVSFERYGVDSLLVLTLINALRSHFSNISSVLLFEVNTLTLLADYLIENNHTELCEAIGVTHEQQGEAVEKSDSITVNTSVQQERWRSKFDSKDLPISVNYDKDDVAIIGMSGRFADADDLDEFWHNISNAKDSISRISTKRANWQAYKKFDKAGFMNGIDEFDPLFFHLSPAEAEQMDPQERVFIQETYHCFEEAGYAPLSMAQNNKVGVYVGIMNSHYAPHAAFWSVANRVSYLFDLKGPSLAIDTACSSSLTAVHLALESLRSGSVDMAIAGGVNVIVDPQHLQILDDMSLLSADAKCKAFGQGGDGIAIGEGVGTLLLKPLNRAISDGDHIHGIIKGTALNSGGKSSSYTAPKASAQAQLLQDAWNNAKVNPSDISYIESHGTGTELGDPIEFEGLNQAFKQKLDTSAGCLLGSVKSNIGHLESAAGIAGICKVILQMQHQQIVPTLHCNESNPHLNIDGSPFELATQSQVWQRDATVSQQPYIAGVSSFGAGGANAHVVLQEYRVELQQSDQISQQVSQQVSKQAIVLSAQSPQQLAIVAKQLHDHLLTKTSKGGQQNYLANMAWTLQTGRDAMPHRLAIICETLNDVVNSLDEYVKTTGTSPNRLESSVDTTSDLTPDEAMDELITAWANRGEMHKVAALWVKGYDINWSKINAGVNRQKVSLPVYPFTKNRYWHDHTATSLPSARDHQPNKPVVTTTQSVQQTTITAPIITPIIEHLREKVAALLKVPVKDISEHEPLENYGLDSVMVIKLIERLADRFGQLSKTAIFEHGTLADFAAFLSQYEQEEASLEKTEDDHKPLITNEPDVNDIAIIGIAGRYPQAQNLQEFWHNLAQGKDAVTTVPVERWKPSAEFSGVTQKGGFIDNAEYFDAAFFNMLPDDAELSDPQERLFVETVYHAIENSGYTHNNLTGSDTHNGVGVYVGVMYEDYQMYGVEAAQKGQQMALSGSPASIANRVSYLFDFNGPSLAVDSMCSSSFSAIHLACQAIKNGDCTVAVAGGVNLTLHENKYRMLNIGGFSSLNGHCAAFGQSGDGYVPSEGVGAVVLKPLSEAKSHGDHIIGVIKATALNHGGKSNGYTVPNATAQAQVIRSALTQCSFNADHINYIEAHGTGTVLGDPIEIEGLMQSYGSNTGQGHCAIGSVKSNIGHCESAAGMASLSKVLLQIQHKQLVPSLFAEPANPHIDFAATPFHVQSDLSPWPSLYDEKGQVQPLRAGISSFGAGGVNSHMVIEQYIDDQPHTNTDASALMVLSARTEQALSQMVINLYQHLQDHATQALSDVAFTLQTGRQAMSHRLAFVADDHQHCLRILDALIHQKNEINVYKGQVSRRQQRAQTTTVMHNSLDDVAKAWMQGQNIDWHQLYDNPRRVVLPLYPFEPKAYWAPSQLNKDQPETSVNHYETLMVEPLWITKVCQQSIKRNRHEIIFLSNTAAQSVMQSSSRGDVIYDDSLLNIGDFMTKMLKLTTRLRSLLNAKKNQNTVIQMVFDKTVLNAELLAVAALVRSLNQESNNLHCQVIVIDQKAPHIIDQLLSEAQSTDEVIRYHNHRQVRRLQASQRGRISEQKLWRTGHVFVISGGAGGLGWIFTQAIAAQVRQATVVLLGRSQLLMQRINDIRALNKQGVNIIYHQLDVTDKAALQTVIDETFSQWGHIDHVIHSAGVLRDGYLINKSEADISRVLQPKIMGTKQLDEATKNHQLSSFCCFSSIAGVTGNAGQSDYALANGYLDGFAIDRTLKVAKKQRFGQTLSINWGLWQSGGMQMDTTSEQLLLRNYGLAGMPSKVGVDAYVQALSQSPAQILVAYGNVDVISQTLDNGLVDQAVTTQPAVDDITSSKTQALHPVNQQHIQTKILTIVAEILRVDENEVDVLLALGEYGFDSISFTQLADKVSQQCEVAIQPSDVFSYPTIAELSAFVTSQMDSSTTICTSDDSPMLLTHPLIDQRFSDDLFAVHLSAEQALLKDHLINGDRVLPGTAYIEMALAAMAMVDGFGQYSVANINWQQLCVVNQAKTVFILLDKQGAEFSVYSEDGDDKVVHATGEMVSSQHNNYQQKKQSINTEGWQYISAHDCYHAFQSIGVEYGASHQSIQSLWKMDNTVLALLRRHQDTDNDQWLINPMYLDGVLQASLALLVDQQGRFSLSSTDVPFSLAEISIDGPLPEQMWVKVIKQAVGIDFIICDDNGTVCGELRGLKSYPIDINRASKKSQQEQPSAIQQTPRSKSSQQHTAQKETESVAIIGMSGSFPQAKNLDEFWANLVAGKDAIGEIPADRWDWQTIYGDPLLKEGHTNIKWGGFMDNMNHFDYPFFGLSQKEAEILDPQQRLLMMHVWKAIEDAGYAPSSLAGSNTGLIIATVAIDYAFRLDQAKQAIGGRTALGNVASVGPNRMSYLLDIHGPSETVETACSSSLVAIHRGVQAINNGESDMVIVGGINTISTAKGHIGFSQSGMLSPTGRCHAFAQQADGYVRSEGVGMLVLKSLAAAKADGDPIHGVILGSGVNHGGRANSLTSPNPKAQSALIASVMNKSQISPDSISFIESHGTGTRLGDPIEIDALKQAYQRIYQTSGVLPSEQSIAIGALKSHIGHLEMASGIAGVIKVLLQMQHKTLIGNLHCDKPNPYINFEQSPFYLSQRTQPWQAPYVGDNKQQQWPLRAGISSFGFGGVNAHVVIEAGHSHQKSLGQTQQQAELFVVSAQSSSSLINMCQQLLHWIDMKNQHTEHLRVADVTWTLKNGRDAMSHRLAFVTESVVHIKEMLSCFIADQAHSALYTGVIERNKRPSESTTAIKQIPNLADANTLNSIAQQWVSGVLFDWTELYRGQSLQTLHMPSYVFDGHKCWVDVDPQPVAADEAKSTVQTPQSTTLDNTFLQIIADETGVAQKDIDITESFENMGIDSITKLHLVSRLNQLHVGFLDKKQSDDLLRIGTIDQALTYLQNLQPQEASTTLSSEVLLDLLAEFFDIDRGFITLESQFDDMGVDSIAFIRLIAYVTEQYPRYHLTDKSETLLLSKSVKQLFDNIHAQSAQVKAPSTKNKKATEDVVSTLPTIKTISSIVKENSINHVVHNIQGTKKGKVFAVGLLTVDESHPFFFDHPLDHVSGMHLAQAMSDVTKSSYINHHGLPEDSALLIKEFKLNFPNTCNKTDHTKVLSRLKKSGVSGDVYRAKVSQNGAIVAEAQILITAHQTSSGLKAKKQHQADTHYDALVEPALVNKKQQHNVLITGLTERVNKQMKEQTTHQGPNMSCDLVVHPDAIYFNDFVGHHLDTLVIAEAARQCLRLAIAHDYPDLLAELKRDDQPYHSFLKNITVTMNKAVVKNHPVDLAITTCHLSETGSAKYFELSGDIRYDNHTYGSFSVSALMMSDALLKNWTTTTEEPHHDSTIKPH